MENFFETMGQTLTNSEHNISYTENGAAGWRSTGKNLLDLNFALSSLRNASADEIVARYRDALADDFSMAVLWLFYARDIRRGLGERRVFRICLKYLAEFRPEVVKELVVHVPEFGRWDDLWVLLDTPVGLTVRALVKNQLSEDTRAMLAERPVSLLSKWLPSINASSKETQKLGRIFASFLGTSEKGYRKILSRMRAYINVVERKMSAKQWSEIDYEAVPSQANSRYFQAFLRNDEKRRSEFLSKLEKGEAKINAGTLFPHDIVHRYMNNAGGFIHGVNDYDAALEGLWKALPDALEGNDRSTIVVADGSGSMCATIGGTQVMALDVANALAIYFAERLSGPYQNKYITFSERPQLVNLGGCRSLRDKLATALRHDEVANTNVEAVFNLILKTAINNKLRQEELPKNILIISDCEFDYQVTSPCDSTLFESIGRRYADRGYQLPRLVFWNVNSRTNTIPVKENENGVALVSGFSPNVAKMVMSGEVDPYKCLLEVLLSSRYDPIRACLP